ncbi:MAG: sugar ABC transporter permease [Clostridiales bacterium]|nr:sugar ABC transporter permease [Clostridiales bacterium]
MKTLSTNRQAIQSQSLSYRMKRDFMRNKYLYLLFIPVAIYFILFCYKPMYGVIIAFKHFSAAKGITGSPWAGFENFQRFFGDYHFGRLIKNTFLISLYSILWGFPIPIIFALMLDELRSIRFKKLIQTSSYLPHFISLVVVCSMIKQFSMTNGLFNDIAVLLGGERTQILQDAKKFRTVYVASGVWQEFGWNSIIYLAALAGVDQELYEAARIDGAGRWAQVRHVSIPGIATTIIMLFILRMGGVLNVGAQKVLLLYNSATYSTSDVISTYVYRRGMINGEMSFSTAVGLFNSIINVIFLVSTNYISKKVSDISMF